MKKITKSLLISSSHHSEFEEKLNSTIEVVNQQFNTVLDIKFSTDETTWNALILIQENSDYDCKP